MQISSNQTQNLARNSASKGSKNPDEVSPEFPERYQDPGPDDVYDPDTARRPSREYDGPHYYDSGSDGGGAWFLG